MLTRSLFSSDKNIWETPQALFDELDREFHFTLDAAASDTNHKCDRYYTKEQNSLIQDWGGKQYFAIPPTVMQKQEYGQRNVMKKHRNQTHVLYCLYRPEQTERHSMTTYITKQKYGLSEED